ncbi:hypothetical protein [Wenxinia marina]|uniref:Uncharacterized protein n=1 Tax=Wenxinia marina DSM 24838 TaxID=1123501 RepID=A0A0D0PIC6_9RHOB|nr:hypothetical protein [Wenxinia marina]KIQ71131.1 hypothetical protein Wenmar_00510 [Wenxinia marina DSM 24838]GGL54605.1 hypothetical protein GCM10011392_06270 [Wenxinia marina]
MRRLLALLCLAALPAAAQEATEVQTDLDGDGTIETWVMETDDAGGALLTVDGLDGIRVYRDVVWSGAMAGTTPSLDVAPNGSLQIVSQNEAIGRDRWRQVLTVAFRDGAYRVAGFSYDWYDTLNPDSRGLCDLNLLTGRGVVMDGDHEAEVDASVPALPLAQWTSDTFPGECLP